jgi:phosphatidylethanolamine/phosphatidyl-N-methylethanolamine N-methyltransferase
MSVLFLKRFLSRPKQVASIIPSSRTLIRKVSEKMRFDRPRVIGEFGPGEGCHTREIAKRMCPQSKLILFELDSEFAGHLQRVFRDDPRVTVLNSDAAALPQALASRGLQHFDYVVSGIPFSLLEPEKKRNLLKATFDSLAPHDDSALIIYQVTNELREKGHCDHFPRAESEYCLVNIPPMFVTKFYKTANGHSKHAENA